MAGNSFGQVFKVTTFGESHGEALGCIIDGCPAGIDFDQDFLQKMMDMRKPGAANNVAVTARSEADRAQVLSGVFEGKTTGTPIAIIRFQRIILQLKIRSGRDMQITLTCKSTAFGITVGEDVPAEGKHVPVLPPVLLP